MDGGGALSPSVAAAGSKRGKISAEDADDAFGQRRRPTRKHAAHAPAASLSIRWLHGSSEHGREEGARCLPLLQQPQASVELLLRLLVVMMSWPTSLGSNGIMGRGAVRFWDEPGTRTPPNLDPADSIAWGLWADYCNSIEH